MQRTGAYIAAALQLVPQGRVLGCHLPSDEQIHLHGKHSHTHANMSHLLGLLWCAMDVP